MALSKFVTNDNIVIFRLSGKLIASTIDTARLAIDSALEGESAKVILNFRLVNIVDSVAVGLLISRVKAAKRKNGAALKICSPQPALRRLLELADLDKWLEPHETEESAIESIRLESKGARV